MKPFLVTFEYPETNGLYIAAENEEAARVAAQAMLEIQFEGKKVSVLSATDASVKKDPVLAN